MCCCSTQQCCIMEREVGLNVLLQYTALLYYGEGGRS